MDTIEQQASEIQRLKEQLSEEVKLRKRATTDLQQVEQRYRQLNAIYPAGIFHSDLKGRNIYINETALKIEGLSLAQALGDGWTKHVHPDDLEGLLAKWQKARETDGKINTEYRFKHKDRIIWVNVRSVPDFDEFGNKVGYVGTIFDITELRQAEEILKQQQEELAHFSRLNSMGEVVSGIAHELNQPLTAINNFISGSKRLLHNLDVEIPEKIFNALDQASRQAQRAGTVIHHLKDFLRKGTLCKTSFDINEAIDVVLQLLSSRFTQENAQLQLELDQSLPNIFADKIHIEQVILNIIGNALDAVANKIGKITVRTERYLNEQIRISIIDNGKGIAKTELDNIFNPFVTSKNHGMGIGLSLSQNLVEQHDGRILVNSEPGKGATFHIILPSV